VVDQIILGFTFFAFFSELWLIYINYLARVRYKKYFVEMNPTWRWFDKKGLAHLSLVLSFIIDTTIILAFGMSTLTGAFLGLITGMLFTNAAFDQITFRRGFICIKSGCAILEDRITKCMNCTFQEEYNVGSFSLKLYQKKRETKFKQEYPHIIGFFKWICDIILRKKSRKMGVR